jgi:glutathione peroxidase
MDAEQFYSIQATDIRGRNFDFNQLRGKVVLVVNTASDCGFTAQYAGLEQLYKHYGSKGLVVLGFPCNQFGQQEAADDQAIAQFCERQFGLSLPMFAKIEVNGPGQAPVFEILKSAAPGLLGKDITWNFTKFLVSRDGTKVKRYAPGTPPQKLVKQIEALLAP